MGNFYGSYRLRIALLPLLRQSAHPRIVNVSSGTGGVNEVGGWSPGYRVSKVALNGVTPILWTELKGERFLVNVWGAGIGLSDLAQGAFFART